MNAQGPSLTLYEQNTDNVVQVSPSGSRAVRFTQNAGSRFETLLLVTLARSSKRGCGEKDRWRLWIVPTEEKHEETGAQYA